MRRYTFTRCSVPLSGASPIAFAHLNGVAGFAPLLKSKQYGALTSVNRMGAMAYDPGGAYRGGRAPLRWATQLFQNGEIWLASNTMIVRERGSRPEWVPIPFIPAVNLEAIFFEKTRVRRPTPEPEVSVQGRDGARRNDRRRACG